MYVTLEVSDEEDNHEYDKKIPSNLPKPDFMPTRLVRIYDMAVVNGSDVNEGYCALSYSWSQSGEILHDEATGKYKRIDEGKHKIIFYFSTMYPDIVISGFKAYGNERLWKIYNVLHIVRGNYIDEIRYVKFEGIIQQICQRFNIKYIWYDQMCINQKNKEEKQNEIRNMHYIYSNAHCTVALVPEHKFGDESLGESLGEKEEYFKRLWTLEEAIKSERLLFVGRNVHKWGEDLTGLFDDAKILNKPLSKISVSQILYHAHQRTSTKEHDRVFALIHLFPEFMQHISIDYNQPFEKLMVQFYILLAKKDLSILLFANNTYGDYNSTISEYKFLPSWTGVNGEHTTEGATTSFQNYDIVGKTMLVTSKFVTNGQVMDNDALTIRNKNLPPPPVDINDGDNKRYYWLCIAVRLPGTSKTRNVTLLDSFYHIVEEEERRDIISEKLKRLSRFMETKKENLYWCHTHREKYQKVIDINFNCLTEDTDDLSAQYIILSDVLFKSEFGLFLYPVMKNRQGEEYYKAIGYCEIRSNGDIFSDCCNLPKQTFSIQ